MKKNLELLRKKHLILKGSFALALVLAILILVFALRTTNTLLKIGAVLLLVVASFLFILSLTTKTLKYKIGERNFYIVKGLFKHHLLSTHHLLDETTTVWFGTHSMYYEFPKMEVEAKLGLFQPTKMFVNNEELKRIK